MVAAFLQGLLQVAANLTPSFPATTSYLAKRAECRGKWMKLNLLGSGKTE